MNQKDKDKILIKIKGMSIWERNEMLFFLIGYHEECTDQLWEGMAAFLHLDIKEQ